MFNWYLGLCRRKQHLAGASSEKTLMSIPSSGSDPKKPTPVPGHYCQNSIPHNVGLKQLKKSLRLFCVDNSYKMSYC